MFCRKCGKELPDGMTLCEECSAASAAPAAAAAPKKFSLSPKVIKIGVAILAAVAVLATAVIVLFSTVFNRLKLTDYIKITGVEGYDGYATLTYEVDFRELAEKLKFEKKSDIKKFQKLIEEGEIEIPTTKDEVEAIENEYDLKLKEIRKLIGAFEIEIENNGSLSNGETAKLVIEADEDSDLKKKLVGGELTYEVKDLKVLEKLSLFDAYEVTFEGMNGEAYANVSRKDYGGWKSSLKYTIDKNEDLSNGDTVKVTLTVSSYEYYAEDLMEQGYYLPESEEKTFTVSGLSSYLTKDKITDAVLNDAIAKAKAYFGDPDEFTVGKVYFIKLKEGESSYYGNNLFAVTFSSPGRYFTTNRIIGVQNNTVSAEGKVELATRASYMYGGTDATEASMLEALQSRYGDEYTIETLK